ncbi:MAG TPA: hypothetical protein PLV68_03280, partial [Ilumatobacteraceae bacterium]|nr:hypothetical protein [Ilumatobacteraceae bacterium]
MPSKSKVDRWAVPEVKKRGSLEGKAIGFCEKRLLIPDSRQPLKLHPYQRALFEEWADPSNLCHATVIGAGNAKTTTLAAFARACMCLARRTTQCALSTSSTLVVRGVRHGGPGRQARPPEGWRRSS